jgi:hypothetical protein
MSHVHESAVFTIGLFVRNAAGRGSEGSRLVVWPVLVPVPARRFGSPGLLALASLTVMEPYDKVAYIYKVQ